MKSIALRALAMLVLAALAVVALVAATSPHKIENPDKLIILSTVDVKGKTSPCG